jgi:hypothetical protein
MNATIRRFGYPATLVAEFAHWVVLLRPEQPTLGSLILAAKSDATAFSDLPAAAFAELAEATAAIEGAPAHRGRLCPHQLSDADDGRPPRPLPRDPRYEGTRGAEGISVPDAGWPKAPALGEAIALDDAQIAALVGWLKERWPA